MAVSAGRVVYVKISEQGVGGTGVTWTTIGQQRGGGMSRATDTADASHKDSGNFAVAIGVRINWSISCEGALDASDTAWTYLLTQWAARSRVWVQLDASGMEGTGEKVEGQAWITDLSYEVPEGDVVSFSIELQGDGALNDSP